MLLQSRAKTVLHLFMEYIDGRPFLSKIIKTEFPFEDSRIIRIFTQLCDVLAAGHKLGIVHRDLKPDNIMVLDCLRKRTL